MFCWFPAAILVDHASANNSETMYQTEVRPGEVAYVLVFYNIFMFLAFFVERLRIYFLWRDSENDL